MTEQEALAEALANGWSEMHQLAWQQTLGPGMCPDLWPDDGDAGDE